MRLLLSVSVALLLLPGSAMAQTFQVATADSAQLVPNRIISRSRAMQETLLEVKRLVLTRDQFEQAARTDTLTITIGDWGGPVRREPRAPHRHAPHTGVSSSPPRRASETDPSDDTSSQSSDAEG